jgi:DNA primase large subunit
MLILQAHNRLLPEIENDDRIFKLINSLHTSYTGKDYTLTANENVPPESLDQLSKKSFPLCMRYMHDILRDKHKLKYRGRIMYGLFLKGIGVTLEDALRFFREEFCKVIDLDKFEKSYSYGIRYNYGKEGARTNFTPYSCMKIIQTMPGPDETHGCPYRLFQPSLLRSKLQSYGCGSGHAQEVAQIAEKGHYQLACGRYFEVTHNEKLLEGINHPNHYFELSQIMMGDRQPKVKAAAASTSRASNTQSSREVLVKKRKNVSDFQGDRELWDFSQVDLEAVSQTQTQTQTQVSAEKEVKVEPGSLEVKSSGESVVDTDWGQDDEDDFDLSVIDC